MNLQKQLNLKNFVITSIKTSTIEHKQKHKYLQTRESFATHILWSEVKLNQVWILTLFLIIYSALFSSFFCLQTVIIINVDLLMAVIKLNAPVS